MSPRRADTYSVYRSYLVWHEANGDGNPPATRRAVTDALFDHYRGLGDVAREGKIPVEAGARRPKTVFLTLTVTQTGTVYSTQRMPTPRSGIKPMLGPEGQRDKGTAPTGRPSPSGRCASPRCAGRGRKPTQRQQAGSTGGLRSPTRNRHHRPAWTGT